MSIDLTEVLALVSTLQDKLLALHEEPEEPNPEDPTPDPTPTLPNQFKLPGVFFEPTEDEPVKRIVLPQKPGPYTKVQVALRVYVGDWHSNEPDRIHNIFWLAPDGENYNRIGYVNARGPKRNLVYAVHHYGIPKLDNNIRLDGKYALTPGKWYRFVFDYSADFVALEVIPEDATELPPNLRAYRIEQRPGPKEAREIKARKNYVIDFGLKDEAADAPTIGWKYADLSITMK